MAIVAQRARDYWLKRVDQIKQWREPGQSGRRAPHKPLVLLHALAQLHNDRNSRVRYKDLAPRLSEWLAEFGPPRRVAHPEQPFWRLQNDGLWSVSTQGDADGTDAAALTVTGGSSSPSHRQLIDSKAVGQLDDDFEAALIGDPGLLLTAARTLLVANWPESLHSEICMSIGLDLDALESSLVAARAHALTEQKHRRDPNFRVRVLRAYEYQCAMCGFDGRLDSATVGLEAAHVQWWAEGGPDHTFNGLCLCVMHHKLFDLGVLGLGRTQRILVSSHFVGRNNAADELVTSLIGKDLRPPRSDSDAIVEQHRDWHEREVFRGPPR
ncbi:MAG: HNH endonuclease [Acidimicrobiaceae bacterium]|nr:HNH endonuclease [Acidimicrobiaceae bacterium]